MDITVSQKEYLQYKIIDILRFPMAILVVFIHSTFEHEIRDGISVFDGLETPVYDNVSYLLTHIICQTAVPMFFIVSGFLFFFKDESFTKKIYLNKLKKRIKSLLVPYLIWNFMVVLLYLVVQYVVPDMVSGRNKAIVDYSFFDYVMSFWSMSIVNHQGVNGPINGPLWFIRDLMVMVVISPLIYWLIKKFKIWIVMGFIVLWLSGIWDGVPGLGIDAILFFSLGAYLGMRKSNFIKTIQPVMWYSIMLYLIMMTSELLLRDSLTGWCHKLTVIVGIVMFVSLAVWLLKKREVNTFFAEYTFFVFASHNEILKIFIRLITKIHLTSDWAFVVAYFVCPVITIVTCCCIFKLMKMCCPRVMDLVCGGR